MGESTSKSQAVGLAILISVAIPSIVSAAPSKTGITPPREIYDITIRPTDSDGRADGVDISYIWRRAGPSRPITLYWDTLVPAPSRSSDQIQRLEVSDALGPIVIRAMPTAPGDERQKFVATRLSKGPVSVRYHVPVAVPLPYNRGPHREMQAAGGGIVTEGDGILLLPEVDGRAKYRIHWKVAPGIGSDSSFGVGDVEVDRRSEDITRAFYAAGPLSTFPRIPPKNGFSAFWLGDTDIDRAALSAWSVKSFEAMRQAFRGSTYASFRAFYRSYNGGPLDSGRANHDAILLYIAPKHEERDATQELRTLMAHEMVHIFQPDIADEDANLWFVEGSADYFSAVVPFADGLYSRAEYISLINQRANQYYGNGLRNIPNSAVARASGTAPNAWQVPYVRGFLYFADLDARLRKVSGGHVTVMRLMREFAAIAQAGGHADAAAWRGLVQKNGGEPAADAFDAMLAGKTILPVSGAFGRCLTAVRSTIGVFDLGYKRKQGTDVVAEVTPASPAARAGLRAGDKINGELLLYPIYSDPDRELTLPIARDGRSMTLRYLPRKGSVTAIHWVKAEDKKLPPRCV